MHQSTGIPVKIVLALGFTMMLGPFAIDTYLPAFPLIADALDVDVHDVSLSISIYLIGFAVGQLSGGPLSDRYGRRRVLVGGLSIFAAASFFLSRVDSLDMLLLGRLLQSIGGGWTGVSIPALIRDRVTGVQAAKSFSLVGMVATIAPAIAPAIGAGLLELGEWDLVFLFLGTYALCLLPLLTLTVFRGPGRTRALPDRSSLLSRYKAVLFTPEALPYIGWQTTAFGGLILFVTYASFIYQSHFGQSRASFTLLFACNIVAMLCCNLLNRMLLDRIQPRTLMASATCIQIGAGLWMVAAALLAWPVQAFLPGMVVYAGMLSFITPNLQACYLEHFARNSGTAAAVMGTAQFGLGGLASAASNLLPASLLHVVACIAGASLGSLACMLWSRRVERRRPRTGVD